MRRPKKFHYEVTCFDSVWWDFSSKTWVRIDSNDFEGNSTYRNVGSHRKVRDLKQAMSTARHLHTMGVTEVEILRWGRRKGQRNLSVITVRNETQAR